jgi:enterochelin esterase-like enzyme
MKKFLFKLGIIVVILFSLPSKIKAQESHYFTDSIYSEFLGEYRKMNVYLPKNFKKGTKYPVIYATDGSTINSSDFYKRVFDSLIKNKLTQDFIFVHSFNNPKTADFVLTGNKDTTYLSYRNYEYVESNCESNSNPELKILFSKHFSYFTKELIPFFEAKYELNISKMDRFFYGVSNGAGFGANMLSKNQNIIGTYICFSTIGAYSYDNFNWDKSKKYPNLYLRYGEQEEFFAGPTNKTIVKFYKKTKSFVDLEVYKGGHDYKMWNKLFPELLVKLL